jgi:hypothetical protein
MTAAACFVVQRLNRKPTVTATATEAAADKTAVARGGKSLICR